MIKDVLNKFVTVRLVQANAMDLTLFQFDFDLTFAAFFLNADGTIYGRFGTRSDEAAMRDISMEGLRKALQGALELHEAYPANKGALVAKRAQITRYKRPERYPSLKHYRPKLDYGGKVVQSCMHCHQIRDAERKLVREKRKPMSDELIFPWPLPDTVGLKLDPKERATVVSVTEGSAAAKAGFVPGDDIVSLNGQPLLSIADVQWVLETTGASARIPAVVWRKIKNAPKPFEGTSAKMNLTLVLDKGWRRASDISWRVTTWDLRRIAFGGMVLETVPDSDGKSMRLRAKHVGRYGNHRVAMNAGIKKGDIITSFDGQKKAMTESELLAWVLKNRTAGARVKITYERGGKTYEAKFRLQ